MKKTLLASLLILAMVLLSGCGSNDFDTDTNATSSTTLSVITPDGSAYTIDQADHDYPVVLKAMDGNESLSGKVVKIMTTDFVGSFSAQQATTDDEGKASFTYHSPQDVDVNKTFSITFAFEEDAKMG